LLKKKIIVSACLLGQRCRYDGQTKEFSEVLEFLKGYEVLPFCPEAPLFGTPRERISVVHVKGENRIISDETNRDVTEELQEYTQSFLLQHTSVNKALLKSKSPSCGYNTTPILDEAKQQISVGNGVAADIFLSHNIDIISENNYLKEVEDELK